MGFFDELKSDAMSSIAILGAVLGFVFLFYLWTLGTWVIMLVLIIVLGAYFAFKWLF